MGDFLRVALPGHVRREALSGPPARALSRQTAHSSSTASSARFAQLHGSNTAIQALFSQTPGRIPWGESAPGHGKAPWTSARGGTAARAPSAIHTRAGGASRRMRSLVRALEGCGALECACGGASGGVLLGVPRGAAVGRRPCSGLGCSGGLSSTGAGARPLPPTRRPVAVKAGAAVMPGRECRHLPARLRRILPPCARSGRLVPARPRAAPRTGGAYGSRSSRGVAAGGQPRRCGADRPAHKPPTTPLRLTRHTENHPTRTRAPRPTEVVRRALHTGSV